MKGVSWIFWFTFSGDQVSEFVCQRLSKFRCQRVSFCLSKMFHCLQVLCICLSGGFMVYVLEGFFMSWAFSLSEGFVVGEFLHVQSVCQSFGIKWFLWVLFFVFMSLYSFCQRVSSGFVPMFVKVLGVWRLLQVYCFVVSAMSGFKCQRISSHLVYQFLWGSVIK